MKDFENGIQELQFLKKNVNSMKKVGIMEMETETGNINNESNNNFTCLYR